jgi:hypothetical protein
LSKVKCTLETTIDLLSKLKKKKGFLSLFFLAKSYKEDFSRLNSVLSESLSDLDFVVTATKPFEIDPKVVAEEIYQRLLNTLPDYLCASADRIVSWLICLQINKTRSLI